MRKKKKNKVANYIGITIGAVAICLAIYQLINGESHKQFIMSFCIGLSLVIVGYINRTKHNDRS